MKSIAAPLLVALLTVLAGCVDTNADANTEPNAPESSADIGNQPAAETTSALLLTTEVDTVVVQGSRVTLAGTVNRPATVTVSYGEGSGESFDTNGAWNYTYTPPFGHDNVTITADDGTTTATASVLVKRNMQLTVEVNYDPSAGQTDTTHTLWWDYGGMRSLHEDTTYDGCDQPHPGRPNAHDALLDYEDASGVDIGFTDCGQFGVNISTVGGHESPGSWCFEVNGEGAEFGVSLLELEDGDVFTFLDCFILFPA